MRHFQLARRAGVPTAVVALGLLAATPAFADDVTVSPSTAVQGAGENLTLNVTNTGTQPIGTITVRLPADTPIAEVYPLSVDDWAPKIEPLTLSTPLDTIHGGTPVTETAAAITWIAMPGKQLAPGKSADVALAVGPLPQVSTMKLTIETKYADGKAGPSIPPATLTLTPAQAGQLPPAHHGGATGGGGDTSAAENQLFADAVEDAERGSSIWSYAGWVVAGLVIAGGAVMMLRNRHRRADEDEEPEDDGRTDEVAAAPEEKEPVAAGTSKWAFKG